MHTFHHLRCKALSVNQITFQKSMLSKSNEGVIYFDILFFVRTRDQKSKIIVNIEIQKDIASGRIAEMRIRNMSCIA